MLGLILPPTTQGELPPTAVVLLVTPGARPSWWSSAGGPRPPAPTRSGPSTISTGPTPSASHSPPSRSPPSRRAGRPLGTCVLQLPLRQPPAVAKQATALQLLSGGRFVLGLGVGIHPDEYERAGVDYHRRGRLMDEGVARLREAWEATDERDSEYVQEPAVLHRCRCGSAGRATPPGDAPRPWRRLGPALPRPRTSTRPRWRRSGARRPTPAATPTPSRPAWSSSPAWATTSEAPARGAAWLSHLYRLPAQGVPAPPGRGIARDVRRGPAALRRRRGPPHRGDGGRVARRRALRPAPRRVRLPTRSRS